MTPGSRSATPSLWFCLRMARYSPAAHGHTRPHAACAATHGEGKLHKNKTKKLRTYSMYICTNTDNWAQLMSSLPAFTAGGAMQRLLLQCDQHRGRAPVSWELSGQRRPHAGENTLKKIDCRWVMLHISWYYPLNITFTSSCLSPYMLYQRTSCWP